MSDCPRLTCPHCGNPWHGLRTTGSKRPLCFHCAFTFVIVRGRAFRNEAEAADDLKNQP